MNAQNVKTSAPPERLLKAEELGQYCGGVCPHTLRRWKVPCIRINRRVIRYRLSEVMDYLSSGGAQKAVESRKAKALPLMSANGMTVSKSDSSPAPSDHKDVPITEKAFPLAPLPEPK